ncbi:arsenate reductase (glutaredoxin) [Dokdonia sp. Hel_I_53]|uniref:arsenate reductase (glutaredoxin) n=1 Tax=Dokdonia sp. Hel_I_53 TaxID=1566287 RepID=UPI001199156A|nr:arsenate reductase (glutaredoxin) [Dokdonia sp. Hel_I_53]TVZ51077.1 arsenate reductase [Dokdonia sp. Hel_I_53]
MIKIYHNPRCSKSRQALAEIEASGKDFEIIKYLENPLSTQELKAILAKLNIIPIELARKNESVWKDVYKGKNLSDDEIILAMIENPKLIERPIVIDGKNAVIGRPTQLVTDLLLK